MLPESQPSAAPVSATARSSITASAGLFGSKATGSTETRPNETAERPIDVTA